MLLLRDFRCLPVVGAYNLQDGREKRETGRTVKGDEVDGGEACILGGSLEYIVFLRAMDIRTGFRRTLKKATPLVQEQ